MTDFIHRTLRRLDRWTLTAGKRLKDEPDVDDFVQKIWEKRKPS